jgi:hypothetical protein
MTQTMMEERLAALEKQVGELARRLLALEAPKDWRSTIGMFAGDEVMKEIFEEGRKIREKDRAKARKGVKKRKQRVSK